MVWCPVCCFATGSSLAQVLSDSPSTPSTCTAAAAAACAPTQQESTILSAGGSAQQSGASAVRVAIQVNRRVDWGDRIAVVGEPQALGAWQAGQGLDLVWSQGDVWRAEVGLQPGVHEFKVSAGGWLVGGLLDWSYHPGEDCVCTETDTNIALPRTPLQQQQHPLAHCASTVLNTLRCSLLCLCVVPLCSA